MNDLEKDKTIKALQDQVSQLENIIASMPGHVFWTDQNNRYLGCNNEQAASLGMETRKEIIGKTNRDLLKNPEDADLLDEVNNHVMQTGETYLVEEKSKTLGIYLTKKTPLRNANGDIIGVLGVSFDITDRKRTEKELVHAKEKAEQANQVKTDFIRNMEHDIRTPLCGIMSVAGYLKSKENNASKQEFLGDIEVASNELLNYLNSVLEFSQTGSGTIPLILKEFCLKEVIQSVYNVELLAGKDKGLEIIINYPDSMPPYIIGDKFRLHRILLNLVSNAIKFTDKGAVTITVNILSNDTETNELNLQISVADSGIGIAKDHHEIIYDKFTRCAPSNRGLYKGTGLGLWIVKQFLYELGGYIQLESELGKGSIFHCILKVQVPHVHKELSHHEG